MKRIFDISLPISNKLASWPGSPETIIRRRLDFDKGDKVLNSTVFLDVHTGTHVDAPAHIIQGAEYTHQIDLNHCIGRASLLDLSDIEEEIKPHHLESSDLKSSSERLLVYSLVCIMAQGFNIIRCRCNNPGRIKSYRCT